MGGAVLFGLVCAKLVISDVWTVLVYSFLYELSCLFVINTLVLATSFKLKLVVCIAVVITVNQPCGVRAILSDPDQRDPLD